MNNICALHGKYNTTTCHKCANGYSNNKTQATRSELYLIQGRLLGFAEVAERYQDSIHEINLLKMAEGLKECAQKIEKIAEEL